MRPKSPRTISRRLALRGAAATGLLLLAAGSGAAQSVADAAPAPLPSNSNASRIGVTGPALDGMEKVDATVTALMDKWSIPGAALAIVKDGRLVLAHGYGMADVKAGLAVQPESLFRIASLSKSFTAAAVLQLVEQGQLALDTKVFTLLNQFKPPAGASEDPRLAQITVRQLLHHTGGWDRSVSGDPMFNPVREAAAVGTPAPASPETVIRYMLGQKLDFDPGTKYAYSNLGYCLLGRIVEKVSGQSFVDFAEQQIMQPLGITRMRQGHSLLSGRAPGEVMYYDVPDAASTQCVVPPQTGLVPVPYGGFYLEALDSVGAWIASPIDLVRFISSLDGNRPPSILSPESIATMTERPAPPVAVGAAVYYAMGWEVRPGSNGDANWFHNGDLSGTATYQVRYASGWTYSLLFNTRPKAFGTLISEVDSGMSKVIGSLPQPPPGDLFPQYFPGSQAQGLSLHPGWNLVSGSLLSGARLPAYTFQAGDSAYQSLTDVAAADAAQGYWVFSPVAQATSPTIDSNSPVSLAGQPGGWVMIANPSASVSASVQGADQALVYDASGYHAVTSLSPGQGAWAYSRDGGPITVTPGG